MRKLKATPKLKLLRATSIQLGKPKRDMILNEAVATLQLYSKKTKKGYEIPIDAGLADWLLYKSMAILKAIKAEQMLVNNVVGIDLDAESDEEEEDGEEDEEEEIPLIPSPLLGKIKKVHLDYYS